MCGGVNFVLFSLLFKHLLQFLSYDKALNDFFILYAMQGTPTLMEIANNEAAPDIWTIGVVQASAGHVCILFAVSK